MLIEDEKSSSQEEKVKEKLENKEEEEDLAIDFSKIKEKAKNFFKNIKSNNSEDKESERKNIISENEKKLQEDKVEEKDEEGDLAINFSEIKEKTKKFFKNIKSDNSKDKEESDKKSDEDEIGLDIKKITSYAKKNSKWLIPLALILIVIFFSTYFRIMPSYLPVTDDWATNTVYNYYRSQIGNQINQQYPNLPQQNKDVLIEKGWQKQFTENKEMIKQQIEATSQQYKSQLQDDSGQTYLLAIDPYLWYGEARNHINNGHFGTEIIDGKEINFLRNGRTGKPGQPGSAFHLYFEIFLYKFIHFFSKDASLMSVVFMIPVIIIGLSIIPAFLIGRKITGNVGGFFASIIVATNTALLSRTPAGFSDTDAYNIFFPLLILWLFLEAFDTKETKNKLIYGSLAGFSVGLYSIAWGGWWYAFGFALATLAIYLCYVIITNFKRIKINILSLPPLKNIFLVGIAFFLSSALFISIFSSFSTFISAFRGPFSIITLKNVATASIWPNVLTTVAEFNTIPLETIIGQMGGKILFFIAIFGILLTTIKKDLEENRNVKYAIFLIIWFIGTAYGFTKGIRFGILMVPAFAIAFGAGIGIIYQYVSKWVVKSIGIDKKLTKTIIIALICLLLISSIKATNNTAKNEIPSMNDAWYNTLTKIKDNTTDAITTSWWDFGHWFVAVSERRVTFDGADQGERIHWVGKTLLTSDENVSVGLLRMLNCGQEKPVHVLEKFFDENTIKAVDVLNEMMVLNDKKEAIKLLKTKGLTNTQIAEIIKITYCDDLIEQFYITSEDMVGKAGVWGHFGSWDFTKASMYQQVIKNKTKGKQILTDKFNLTEEEADNYYYQITTTPADQWVSPWPGYQGSAGCNKESDNILVCNINAGQGTARLEIDLKTMNA
ncbi:MAG: dolichyl-diphosphooligosaccharide--protein glycosyltransferase subunit STT3, partial [Nanoarchaeota archaeon]|nr:dolichyl-diphosphooligosaccharide--protein glycosyltransferase subunit STT3 [Nanoarchaeota archaeon]